MRLLSVDGLHDLASIRGDVPAAQGPGGYEGPTAVWRQGGPAIAKGVGLLHLGWLMHETERIDARWRMGLPHAIYLAHRPVAQGAQHLIAMGRGFSFGALEVGAGGDLSQQVVGISGQPRLSLTVSPPKARA